MTEEASEDTADIEFSDGDVAESEEETTDSPEIVEEVDSEEPELTSEDTNVDVVSDGQTSVVPDTGITEIEADGVYPVDIVKEDQRAWFSFTPKEDGVYEFYSTGTYDTEGYFSDSRNTMTHLNIIEARMMRSIITIRAARTVTLNFQRN